MSKIGVFDSGIGGLSVLSEALSKAPGHDYIYLADSLHAPYGEKSPEWITQRSLTLCTWLVSQACEVIVVACNTATAEAVAQVRKKFPSIPIVGVEPGIKPASEISEKKIVGVLATQNTLRSEKFRQLLISLGSNCEFIQQAGIGLVPLIEEGIFSGDRIEALLVEYIVPMIEHGADTIVLGCTHYPFLQPTIKNMFGDRIEIIDTSEAVVRQLVRIAPPATKHQGALVFYSTKNGEQLEVLAKKLVSHPSLQRATSCTVNL